MTASTFNEPLDPHAEPGGVDLHLLGEAATLPSARAGRRLAALQLVVIACYYASVDACVKGLGFGLFLCYQVMPAVRRGELEIVLNDFEPEPLPVALMYPQSRMLSARARSFLDWMAPVLEQSLAEETPGPSTG